VLRGNDGAFALGISTVDLGRDRAVFIPFAVRPAYGLHVAFLRVIDAGQGVPMQDIPLEVKVQGRFKEVSPGVERYEREIGPRSADYREFTTDGTAQAFAFEVHVPEVGFFDSSDPSMYLLDGSGVVQFSESRESGALDPQHRVGPMRWLRAFVMADSNHGWGLYWGNRGTPEYETPYDIAPPDVPIRAQLEIRSYAITIQKVGPTHLRLHNRLAPLPGRVEFLAGAVRSSRFPESRPGYATTAVRVASTTAAWRIRVRSERGASPAHLFLLDCTAPQGCEVIRQMPLHEGEARTTIFAPATGEWRVAVLADEPATRAVSCQLEQLQLSTAGVPEGDGFPPAFQLVGAG